MKVLLDICESTDLKLSEASQKRGVLGTVEGVFFVADKPSRNGRVYPRSLWENVLRSSDVKRLLENRLMIGTVGHDEVDFDSLIRDQKASHVVTELRMLPDGKGYGKAEILDTPVGRILHTLLKSGSKMSVSSKGYGDYSGMTEDGIQEVDPNTYVLERFDFVVDPGFLEARPALREQYEKAIKSPKDDLEAIRKLIKIKQDLEEKIASVCNKNDFDSHLEKLCDKLVEDFGINPDDLRGKSYSEILEKVNASLDLIKSRLSPSKEVKNMPETREELKKKILERIKQRVAERSDKAGEEADEKKSRSELIEKLRRRMRLRRLIERRRETTTPRTSRRVLARRRSTLRRPSRIRESISARLRLRRLIERRRRLATLGTRARRLTSPVRRSSLAGTRRATAESTESRRLKLLLRKALPIIKEVNRLGGIDNIKKGLKESKATLTQLGKKLLDEHADRLSAMTGVSKDVAKKLIKKYGFEEAKAHLVAKKSVSESKVPKKVVTDSPVASGENRPLSEVILKRINEQVKAPPVTLSQDWYKTT